MGQDVGMQRDVCQGHAAQSLNNKKPAGMIHAGLFVGQAFLPVTATLGSR